MARRRSFNLDLSPLMNIMNQQYQTQKMYEQDRLLNERQQANNEAITERQSTLDKAKWEREQLMKAATDPVLAAHMARMPQFAGRVNQPDPTQITGPIMSKLGESKTVPDVPSMEGLVGEYQAKSGGPINGPEYLGLNQARGKRIEDLIAEQKRAQGQQPVDFTSVNPEGNTTRSFTTRGVAEGMGPIPTERTPGQEVNRTLNTTLSPQVVNAEVGKAGRTAGAQAAAQQGVEYSPAGIAGAGAKAGAIATAQDEAKGATPDDRKATAFYVRAANAAANAEEIEKNYGDINTLSAKYMFEPFKSTIAKKYTAAKNEFALSALRRETGAQVNAEEFDKVDKAYFTQPGDDPTAIAVKKAARDRMVESLRFEATKGMKELNRMGPDRPALKLPGGSVYDQRIKQ